MIDNKDCCDHGDHIHNHEVKIDYPCEWSYKVIGNDKESVHNAVACIIEDREYQARRENTGALM